jgi:hypothetical protein
MQLAMLSRRLIHCNRGEGEHRDAPDARWRLLFAACAVLTVAPLHAARHLPLTDLPEHVAAMSTLRHWLDPAWPDARIYELSARASPYLAYHAVGALLTLVSGSALTANLVLMTAVGLAMPYATRALVVAFGGDGRLGLFGCALFWSRPLALGFLPFVAALPVTLYVLALVARQRETPTRRRAAALAVLSLVVFYLHLDPFLLVVAVAVVLLRSPARLVWLAPGAVAFVAWLALARAEGGADFMGQGPVNFVRLSQLASEFPAWAHGVWRTRIDEVTGIALWALALVLAVRARAPEPRGVRGLVTRLVPLACALLLFAFVPYGVGVTSMLNVRLAVFLLPCFLVVLRPDPGRVTSAVLLGVAGIDALVSVEAAVQVRRAERDEVAGIDDLFAQVTPGARLLELDFETRSRFAAEAPWIHLGALHRLRGGGVASTSFSEVPHWPLQFRPESRPPSMSGRSLEWRPCKFRNSFDGPYYDFVLVRGQVDPFRDTPPGPRWTLAGRAGDWALYAKQGGEDVTATRPDVGPCGLTPFD